MIWFLTNYCRDGFKQIDKKNARKAKSALITTFQIPVRSDDEDDPFDLQVEADLDLQGFDFEASDMALGVPDPFREQRDQIVFQSHTQSSLNM